MNNSATQVKQTFCYKAPGATSVLLAGDFTTWLKQPVALHQESSGLWKTSVSLAPGTYHYRFVVDGEWKDDPDCKLRVQNPFGSQNDVVQITQPTPKAGKQTLL
jgi:1,4-alpha-glucan branching enzyme